MDRTIYIREGQVKAVKDEILYGEFEKVLFQFLRQICNNPGDTKLPDLIASAGLSSDDFIEELIRFGLLNRKEKIYDDNQVQGQMSIVYTIPKSNYINKIKPHALWANLFQSDKLDECDCVSCAGMAYEGPITFGTRPPKRRKRRPKGLDWR